MNQEKMHLINKLFNDETIRTVWDKNEEKYYISIVDLISVLTGSSRPRKYWSDLKKKLLEEGHNKLSENIGQLKLKSSDGKYYNTDVCDIEEIFRIIESIPSKNAEPVKQWLAKLGSERINETFDPSIAVQRAIDLYRAKGYSEEWIIRRIKALQDRKRLTDVWNDHGVNTEIEYAILTNEIYKGWSGMNAKEYKAFKGLRKENLRDNMSSIELALANLGEAATEELVKAKNPNGLEENKKVAKRGGSIAKVARNELEKDLGKSVLSSDNYLDYQYKDEKQIENK